MNEIHPQPSRQAAGSIKAGAVEARPILADISIVIPTLGRDILEQSLYWIASGSAWPACLIVVNQGPGDAIDGWLQVLQAQGMHTKHIRSKQRGRSAGVNRGIEQVDTAYFAVTDDDCFVDSDWLSNMRSSLASHPDAVVTGRVGAAGEGTKFVVTSMQPALYRKPRLKFDAMSGGNMGTSLSVVRQVGLFDEDPRLSTAEDAEWSYRALRKGISIVYAPEVCVHHYGWRDDAARAGQYRSYARSHGGFYGKYIRKGDLFILLRALLHHIRALRWWLRGKAAGDADLTLQGCAYFFGLLPGIIAGFRGNRKQQENTTQ